LEPLLLLLARRIPPNRSGWNKLAGRIDFSYCLMGQGQVKQKAGHGQRALPVSKQQAGEPLKPTLIWWLLVAPFLAEQQLSTANHN